jgi:sodium/potassium/calcium exchanger 6
MLNLLLGIGGSGSYGILISRQSVNIHFSPTLWVSASGLIAMLLATAVFVPLNGYLIDRRWAVCLIVAYGVLMTLNVGVELKMGRG